jgi:hypothetical protein
MRNKSILITLILSITLIGCTEFNYRSCTQNVPIIREKNEFHGVIFTNVQNTSYGLETDFIGGVQCAYSITNHIGLMANYQFTNFDYPQGYKKESYFEGAVGYFNPIARHSVFEIYGGYGISNRLNHYESLYYKNDKHTTSEICFTKVFLQPSIGAKFEGFDLAFSARLCKNFYRNIDYYYYDNDDIIVEPAITIRGGWKYVKAQLQLIKTVRFRDPNYAVIGGTIFDDISMNIGITVDLAPRLKK